MPIIIEILKMTLKLRQSSSKSKIHSLARRVEDIQHKKQVKRERIIGPKEYRKHLLETQYLHREPEREQEPTLIGARKTRKSSKADISKARALIQSQGLDTVSRISIPQLPTILDKEKYLKPIIKMGELEIPEMEIDLSNTAEPIITFSRLQQQEQQPQHHEKNQYQQNQQQEQQQEQQQDKPSTKPKAIDSLGNYTIAIPSYNRPDLIQIKTLALLHRHNIPAARITIFVANQEQHDLYKAKIPAWLYGNLVIGVIGLRNQRNFIMDYYPVGAHIVQMDDDLDKIMELIIEPRRVSRKGSRKSTRLSKSTRRMRPILDLDEFIKRAFEICHQKNIYLWGVYPLANTRFMTPKITTDLRFIVGPFWGIINRHLPELRITIDEKENAERTLQHYTIDGAVLRFNNIGIETRYYKNKGGMQDEGKNRKDEALKSVYYLHKKYPKLTKIYLGKKSGVPEIRMLSHPK
jgi:hypothetical protein